jgi:phenylpropionate dioxygenase-like ring-hydroxylating dioxygenase large terminal subunit
MGLLKNIWYVAGWSDELADGGTIARIIAGEPILLYRAEDGSPAALHDECPHRFAPLSSGWIKQGKVQCAYHGLIFDRRGRCVHNPHGTAVSALDIRSYDVVERDDFLWIWLGDPAGADIMSIPDMSMLASQPDQTLIRGYLHAAAHHQLMVDNILDLSHADYLHKEAARFADSSDDPSLITPRYPNPPKVEEIGDRLSVKWLSERATPIEIWQRELPDPSADADMFSEVVWYPGGAMALLTGVNQSGKDRSAAAFSPAVHAMTPETEETTHYFYAVKRNYRVDDTAYHEQLATTLVDAFSNQDQPMIEAQQRRMARQSFMAKKPALLSIDVAAARARRIYDRLLLSEQSVAT